MAEVDKRSQSGLCSRTQRNHPRPESGAIAVKKSGDAVCCVTSDKLVDVLQKLIVEGFLSMPVLSTIDARLVNYIDLLDIVWVSGRHTRGDATSQRIFESDLPAFTLTRCCSVVEPLSLSRCFCFHSVV
jgi:hypothetical protein